MNAMQKKYAMFYAGIDKNNIETIGCALSDDLMHWEDHPCNPIVPIIENRFFASKQTSNPYVYFKDQVFHMIFQAKGTDNLYSLGYASSADLLHWECSETPLLAPSHNTFLKGNRNGYHHPHLVCFKNKVRLYFILQNGLNTELRFAEGNDIHSLEINSSVCLRNELEWENSAIYYPWLDLKNDTWNLWYSAVTSKRSLAWSIGQATSKDGIYWERTSSEPMKFPKTTILDKLCFSSSVNQKNFANPCILKIDNRYLFYFQANLNNRQVIGYASSKDQKRWTLKSCNIFENKVKKDWEIHAQLDPFLISCAR